MLSHASAIAHGNKIRTMSDPTNNFRIKQLLKGASRLRPVSTDGRKALSLSEVMSLCHKLFAVGFHVVDRLAFTAKSISLMGFFSSLRPGDLVKGGAPQHTL